MEPGHNHIEMVVKPIDEMVVKPIDIAATEPMVVVTTEIMTGSSRREGDKYITVTNEIKTEGNKTTETTTTVTEYDDGKTQTRVVIRRQHYACQFTILPGVRRWT